MKALLVGLFLMAALVACLVMAAPPVPQKDFLSNDEIEKIREAQEPSLRLKLYTDFARERIDLVKSLLSKDKSGRSILIHDTLDEYCKIIDAIDTVSEDAITRKQDLKVGLDTVAAAERLMLPSLQRFRDSKPKDLERYEFVLKQAIDATNDSLSSAEEDLHERTLDISERDEKEKRDRREAMTPVEREAENAQQKKAVDKKTEDESKPPARKPPTLYKPGEKKSTGPGGNR